MKNWKALIIGSVAVSISAMLWGLDGVVLTPRLHNLEIGYVVFMLHLLPFVLMQFFLFNRYKIIRKINGSDFSAFFLVALFGGAVGTMAIVKALFLVNFQELSVVVLLQKLQPVFAILLAALILGERVKGNFFLWATVAIIASYFLTFGWELPHVSQNENSALAAVYAMLAAFSFAMATVMSKKVMYKYDFKTATFIRYGLTALIMLPYVLISGHVNQLAVTTQENWLIFLIIGITTGSGAIFLYYFGLQRIKAMIATICELFFPLSAILFDYIFNDSKLTIVQWISAAALITAVIGINISQKKRLKKHSVKETGNQAIN
ncbi:MAG: DMT family transporter [Bacteroidales bacterium]|nr:DMT family transporter [Bacteroidales bacterium]MCF8327880.1 DMT family transporter [Bacteroidales bacterium]